MVVKNYSPFLSEWDFVKDLNMTSKWLTDVAFTSTFLFFSLLLLFRANKAGFRTRVFDVETRSSLPTERMKHRGGMKMLKRFTTDWATFSSFES